MRRPGLVPQHFQGSDHVLSLGTPGPSAIGRKYETSIGPRYRTTRTWRPMCSGDTSVIVKINTGSTKEEPQ
jgi:hypothetical protein